MGYLLSTVVCACVFGRKVNSIHDCNTHCVAPLAIPLPLQATVVLNVVGGLVAIRIPTKFKCSECECLVPWGIVFDRVRVLSINHRLF